MATETFVLNNLTNLDKLSCHTYDPKVLGLLSKLTNKGVQLSKITKEIISGPMGFNLHTYDYVPENYPDRVKLLQISNIGQFGELINTKRDKYISREKDEEIKSSRAIRGDLLIAKTGELGRIALFNEKFKANLNQALGIIRLKDEYGGIKIIPEFIHLYLNSAYSRDQFDRLGGYRAGQSGLSLDEIGSIYIILPEESKQKQIIKLVNDIREKAIEHHYNYVRYSEQSKISIIKILNIAVPDEEERIYIYSGDTNDRMDALYNSPFLNTLKWNLQKTKHEKLINLLEPAKNKFRYSDFYRLVDLDNIDEKTGRIVNFNEVPILNSTKTILEKGNILISKLGGESGNIVLVDEKFDGCVGSGELVPFKLRENSPVSVEYIFYMLRSIYCSKQIEYSLSGCSRMRVPEKEMGNLLIPLPKDKAQENKVVQEIGKLLKDAVEELKNYQNKKQEMYKIFEKKIEANL